MSKVRLYQINLDRDVDQVAFLGHEALQKQQHSPDVNSGIYDLVFDGDIKFGSLEDIYMIFNRQYPEGYSGRSMSVSDVVEIVGEGGESSCFYCNSIGFEKVDFNTEACGKGPLLYDDGPKKITGLLVQPGKRPQKLTIDGSLESLQKTVGGYIELVRPYDSETVIVCNEEGKVNGLPLNRAVYAEPEEVDMTYQEMKNRFREAEKAHGAHLTGYLVFSQESFQSPYSEESRTYQISSDNKAFNCTTGGYSIFGDSLDGSDRGVRLDLYMADERGGKDGWKVERCYMKEDSREMIDIIAGDFFIARADPEEEDLSSLTEEQIRIYGEKFRCPERFYRSGGKIVAEPCEPKNNMTR